MPRRGWTHETDGARRDCGGWPAGTSLEILRGPIDPEDLDGIRRYADGLSSWIIRRPGGPDEWTVFDRPDGSERDLVVLADVLGATVVQRHPTGSVRVSDADGVLRWHGLTWHHEPPVSAPSTTSAPTGSVPCSSTGPTTNPAPPWRPV